MTDRPNRHPGAPMRRESYLKLARELRAAADQIERSCAQLTPQEKRALTLAISGAARKSRAAQLRHNGWSRCPECLR